MRRRDADNQISRLKLIGTVHGDPAGFHRTLRILRQIRPGLIFIELSPYGARFRREHGLCLIQVLNHNVAEAARQCGISYKDALRHPQVEAIRRQIRLPFELRAAALAARLLSARIFLVDQSTFSRRLISSWYDLISEHNLLNLLGLPPEPPSIQAIYRKASRLIAESPSMGLPDFREVESEETSIWIEREAFIAKKIRCITSAFKREKAVYVGGWWHLTTGGNIPTLRDLLGVDLKECLLIDEERHE